MTKQFQPYVEYDEDEDALYVYLSDAEVTSTQELDDLRIIDRDANDQVVGIEFLDPSDGVDLRDIPHRTQVEKLLEPFSFRIVV